MQLRRLGNSGLKVSAIGLGANTFGGSADAAATTAIIHRAIDLGVTFIDTADVYTRGQSEVLIGEALVGKRQQVVLATKCGLPVSDNPYHTGLSRRWIMHSLETSLKKLKTDHVDLYQVHRPDEETPIEETMRALDDAVKQGKIRYVGCSNYAAWQLAEALGVGSANGLVPWVSAQNRWNLIEGLDDPHLLTAAAKFGVGIIPYTPLASGMLTGKYRRGEEPPAGTRAGDMPMIRQRMTDAKLEVVERLTPWAEARGESTARLAISWLLAHPEVSTVIVGARSADQLAENVKAAAWALTPEERDEVAAIARGDA
ncbi:MAG TPA: aldo/keto reductase [Chloroflexota bacterium]|nr:aldo/keto reductase [Chloroflexota bacterium]